MLNLDGDVTFEVADPSWISAGGVQPVKPLCRNSLLTPGNAFLFKTVAVGQAGERLRVPVKIVGRNLKRVSSPGENPPQLPLLRMRLKDGNSGQVLQTVHTFQSGILVVDSSGYVIVTDTFDINLNAFTGRSIQLEGATFFNLSEPGERTPQIAEVYDLRKGASQSRIAGKIAAPAESEVPAQFALSQNYPNPFNPTTTLEFQLPEKTAASLNIYDIQGRLVKTLLKEELEAGIHQALWDGRDELGNAAASGMYLYHFQAGNFVQTRKMLLVR